MDMKCLTNIIVLRHHKGLLMANGVISSDFKIFAYYISLIFHLQPNLLTYIQSSNVNVCWSFSYHIHLSNQHLSLLKVRQTNRPTLVLSHRVTTLLKNVLKQISCLKNEIVFMRNNECV